MDLSRHTTTPRGFMAPPIDSSSSCSEGEWNAEALSPPNPAGALRSNPAADVEAQALSLMATGLGDAIDDDPFLAHGGLRPVAAFSSFEPPPTDRLTESPLSEAYASDSGGALSTDDQWEPGANSPVEAVGVPLQLSPAEHR